MSNLTADTVHRFFIFRHGLATHSKNGYGDQVLNATLLEEGVPAIEKLGTYLKSIPRDYAYSSELPRCRQTAAIVTKATGASFTFDPRLNEYHQEQFAQFTERVNDFLEDVVEVADRLCQKRDCSNDPVTIWICSHGAVIACLKHLLLEGTHVQEDELDYTQPGEVLEIWKRNTKLHIFN